MVEKNDKSEFMLLYCVKMDATASPDAVKSAMDEVAMLTRTAKKSSAKRRNSDAITDTGGMVGEVRSARQGKI